MAPDVLLRGCAECGREDHSPRHILDDGAGPPVLRHLACCADRGCASCAEQLRSEGN